MTYAYITEGMNPEERDEFDKRLAQPEKVQARVERDAVASMMQWAK